MSSGLLKIQRLTEAQALAKLTPYDDNNANTTSYMFLDINDSYRLKGLFYDSAEPEKKIVKCLSCAIDPADITIPISNAVFVNALGSDVTGAREDLAKPFATLNGAKNASIPGDTIFVYSGTYNEANTLHKDGVAWEFVGYPRVNVFASVVWDDLGVDTDINITGTAIINHQGIGQVIRVTGQGSTCYASFEDVTALGGQIFNMQGGKGVITVNRKVEVTLLNRCIQLGGNAEYTFNIDDLFCNSIIGGISNAVNVQNQAPLFEGYCVFNCRTIRSDRATGSTISNQYAGGQGTVVYNVTEKIHRQQLTTLTHTSDSAVQNLAGKIIINGDVDGGVAIAIDSLTQFFNKETTLNGNAFNDGTLPCIGHGADAGFWSNKLATVTLNGKITSSNAKAVKHGTDATAKMFFNGEVNNPSADVLAKAGIYILDNSGPIIFGTSKIIMNNAIGNETSIDTNSVDAQDIKIQGTLGTTTAADGNINNLIVGTALIVDANYE